ncbi:MAG: cysteine--tRNA ligase [Verrucomicrobiae bacterium]|nr:cysteine--tRNA ligase [Verrucomicrobiae bacterium]
MRLFDTLSRQILDLPRPQDRPLRFYCCGPTVYGPAHIGNFRTFLMQDVLRRTLEVAGVDLFHVRNLTDVDDKTIRQSQAEGLPLGEFTKKWTGFFHRDCAELNLLPPTVEPSAVASIAGQIKMVEVLLEKGFAYRSGDGSVYFRVGALPTYGRLSHLQEREITTHTAATDEDEYSKDTAADFALWKGRKPADGPNFWRTPWGEGRPGWHLECSAMCLEHLGETLDLHSGGEDLVFPHHENEIAQSEAANGKPFCHHWFHIAHLMVDGQKMSKSLGNLYTLADLKSRGYAAHEVRYVLVSGSYRQTLNFTLDSLNAARSALGKLRKGAESLARTAGVPMEKLSLQQSLSPGSENRFTVFGGAWEALCDDLNTPRALGELFTGLKVAEEKIRAGGLTAEAAHGLLHELGKCLYALGLTLPDPLAEASPSDVPAEIQALARERWQSKQDKNFARSDELRKQLDTLGWTILDKKDGFEVKRK